MRKISYAALSAALVLLAGCGRNAGTPDEREERDPLVKTGVAYMDQNRWDEAEKAFKEALDADPTMAKPHLDLALIYQQYKPNYIHALYHYDRYLELRPDSGKAEFIREQRAKVLRALEVKTIQDSPEVKKVVAEAQRLMAENDALKKKLAGTAPAPATTPTPPTDSPVRTAAQQKPATGHQIYTVVAGDTLTKIAAKFYGDSAGWEPIFEANRDSLSSPGALRVGQTLVIPNIKP